MMELNILICGTGGQGAVFLGSFLRKFFQDHFPNAVILGTESRGVSQREGSVIASVRIQTELAPQTIFSPEIPSMAADIVIALEPLELLRNFTVVQKNTIILTNNEPVIPKSSVKWMLRNTIQKEASDVFSHSKPEWLINKVENLMKKIPVSCAREEIPLNRKDTSKLSHKDISMQSFSGNPRILDLNFTTIILEEMGENSQLNLVMLGFLSFFTNPIINTKDLLDYTDKGVVKMNSIKKRPQKAIQFGENLAKKYLKLTKS